MLLLVFAPKLIIVRADILPLKYLVLKLLLPIMIVYPYIGMEYDIEVFEK